MKRTNNSTTKPVTIPKEKCPKGFKFGKDYEKHEPCNVCEVWENCGKRNKKLLSIITT